MANESNLFQAYSAALKRRNRTEPQIAIMKETASRWIEKVSNDPCDLSPAKIIKTAETENTELFRADIELLLQMMTDPGLGFGTLTKEMKVALNP